MTKTTRLSALALFGVAALAAATPALAHHPLGGETPQTLWHGFLSGIGHPMIGIDHLAFIIGVGLVSAFAPRRALMPLAFIGATLVGCFLTVAGVTLPWAEAVIAGSVALLGAMVLSGRQIGWTVYAGLFALAGLFHGFAYGGAIVGAEPTVLASYLAGFGLVQYLIAAAVMLVAATVWKASSSLAIQPRIAGAVVAGVGITFLVEHVEGLLFAV